MKTNPNDPAQPSTGCEYINQSDYQPTVGVFGGLTKREYFAAMALQGLSVGKITKDIMAGQCVDIAQCAIEIADQLIEALNKEEQ